MTDQFTISFVSVRLRTTRERLQYELAISLPRVIHQKSQNRIISSKYKFYLHSLAMNKYVGGEMAPKNVFHQASKERSSYDNYLIFIAVTKKGDNDLPNDL